MGHAECNRSVLRHRAVLLYAKDDKEVKEEVEEEIDGSLRDQDRSRWILVDPNVSMHPDGSLLILLDPDGS